MHRPSPSTRLPLLLLSTAAVFGLSSAFAETPYNQVSLRAEASTEIPHDQMQVVLYTEARDTDAGRLAETITHSLNEAIQYSQSAPDVRVSLGNRNSHPVQDERGEKIIAWRERAELRLESSDFAQLSQLTGTLLQSLKMAQMRFTIADSTRATHENLLIEDAIAAFTTRAKLATHALGGQDYKLVSLNLNSQGGYQPPMYRQAVMMSAPKESMGTAPEVEAGSSQITMTADGVIEVVH